MPLAPTPQIAIQGFAALFLKVQLCGTFFKSAYIYMSIVALKRNSRRFQVPVSANGFSLNGGYRNQRVIGNTNLSALTNAHNNICSANDPSIVKLSAKNTKGLIYSTVLFPTCPAGQTENPNYNANWVKNFSPETRSAGQYTTDVVQANAAACVTTKIDSGTDTSGNQCWPDCKARSYHIGGKRFYTTFNAKNSGEYGQGSITAGEYLRAGWLLRNCLPTPKLMAPWPPALLNSGCYHC
jgi:hypothetical protein